MKNKKIIFALLILFIGVVLYSCLRKSVPVKIFRFEKRMFLTQHIDSLRKEYPQFTDFFLDKIIQVKGETDSISDIGFQAFLKEYKNTLYDTVQHVFPTMEAIESELGLAFAQYQRYFPNDSLPSLYSHISGFGQAIVSIGNTISISLDDYLGQSSYYEKLGVFKYMRKDMFPRRIPFDIMEIIAFRKTTPQGMTDNLLSAMIYYGKIMWFLHKIFPDANTEILMNYTSLQQRWCENNEAMMWQHIIKNKHLFSSNYRTIGGYIDQAPFTKGFPTESPDRTGIWIGYHIVTKYMEKHDVSLESLLNDTDYKKILQLSSYNPD